MTSGPVGCGGLPGLPGPAGRRVFRSASGTASLLIAAVLTVLLLIDAVVRAGWAETALIAPWLLLVLWGVYVTTFASHVAIDAEGATVQNLLRVTRIPWSRVTEIGIRYQLRLHLDDGTVVSAFGGPVAGRPARPGMRREGDASRREPPALRDLALIREQHEHAIETGSGGGAVARSWDLRALIAFGGIAAWTLGSVLIAGAAG